MCRLSVIELCTFRDYTGGREYLVDPSYVCIRTSKDTCSSKILNLSIPPHRWKKNQAREDCDFVTIHTMV